MHKNLLTFNIFMTILALVSSIAIIFTGNIESAVAEPSNVNGKQKIDQDASINTNIEGDKNKVKNTIYQDANQELACDGSQIIDQDASINTNIEGDKNKVKNTIYQEACQASDGDSSQKIDQSGKVQNSIDGDKNHIQTKIKQTACQAQ